jgi:hypothetical protein
MPAAREVDAVLPLRLALPLLLSLATACSALLQPSPRCEPTGWVDRIENGMVVVVTEADDESALYPAACLPPSVRPGMKLVRGQPDAAATAQMRTEITTLMERLLKEGDAAKNAARPPPPSGPD